jgi:hypothetical protein
LDTVPQLLQVARLHDSINHAGLLLHRRELVPKKLRHLPNVFRRALQGIEAWVLLDEIRSDLILRGDALGYVAIYIGRGPGVLIRYGRTKLEQRTKPWRPSREATPYRPRTEPKLVEVATGKKFIAENQIAMRKRLAFLGGGNKSNFD